MSKRKMAWILAWAILGPLGCAGSRHEIAGAKERIGIYDSRAVAVAYCGTEHHNREIGRLRQAHKQAIKAGDKKKAKRIEAEGKSRQKRLHRQGFSTAPVDNMLEAIKNRLPEIASQANVSAIVSKWDKKALGRYKSAELVDVTDRIVAQFNPSEKALKAIEEMKSVPPIPLWKMNLIVLFGGCH